MTSTIKLLIQVLGGKAAVAEAEAVAASLKGIHGALANAGSAITNWAGGMHAAFDRLESFGKNLQWTGRQIEYRLTLPLVAAGVAAASFAIKNEAAFVRLQKVYGALGMSQEQITSDTKALGRAFEALSNIFGVNQAVVIGLGADWVQAGASGIAVAKDVRTTLETMVLAETDATTATHDLIVLTQQYGLSSDELRKSLATLNMVQIESATTFGDLIDSLTRSGGSARAAGVDIQHLAALTTAMVPAAGTAAQAGNSLKTIFSRLFAPTKDAAEVMKLMGINIFDASWQALNGVDRIEKLSGAFQKLTPAQQAVASSAIATRFQVARFEVLMRDIANPLGQYHHALTVSGDANKNMAQYVRELGIVLSSQPQAFKILWTQLQNALAHIIVPLLPAILALVSHITNMVGAFSRLNPGTQQFVIFGLAMLALMGPLMAYLGTFAALIGRVGKSFLWFFAANEEGVTGIGEVILGIKKLAQAFIWLGTLPLRVLGGLFDVVWHGMMIAVDGAAKALYALGGVFDAVYGGMAKLAGGFWRYIVYGWNAVQGVITTVWTAVWGFITSVVAGSGATVAAANTGAAASYAVVAASAVAAYGTATEAAGTSALATVGWWTFMGVRWEEFVAMMMETSAGAALALPEATAVAIEATVVEVAAAGPELALAAGTVGTEAGTGFMAALAAALGPAEVVAIVAAVLAAIAVIVVGIIKFHKPIADFLHRVVDDFKNAFAALPHIVGAAIGAVARTLEAAMKSVIHWLSYLNPFSHHSPSLVEQVTAGVDLIANKYASLKNIGTSFRQAVADIAAFGSATSAAKSNLDAQSLASQRADVVSVAPQAGPAFDAMVGSLVPMRDALSSLGVEFTKQEGIVAQWASRLANAESALKPATQSLDALKATAGALSDQLSAAKQTLDELSNTPLVGMKAMNDQIFANDEAQKQLQLELLKMADAGNGVDAVNKKLADMQGQLETLRGKAAELRQNGAGSDVLAPVMSQIAGITGAQNSLTGTANQANDLSAQLDALQRKGEILKLTYATTFDPLLKQMKDVTDTSKEMPFSEVMAKLKDQQAEVDRLSGAWKQANDAVTAQQAVVDQLTAARDALKATYDDENQKLSDLGDAYDAIEKQIRDAESAVNDFASAIAAAKSAQSSQSLAEQNFNAAGAGNFDIPGGNGSVSQNETGDINALADQWAKESQHLFGSFDIFKPVKDQWHNVWSWVKDHSKEAADGVGSGLQDAWHWIDSFWNSTISPKLGVISTAVGAIATPFVLVGMVVGRAFGTIVSIVTAVATAIGSFVSGVASALAPLGPVIDGIGSGFAAAFQIVGDTAELCWKILKPIFQIIGEVISGYLIPMFSSWLAVAQEVFQGIATQVDVTWNHLIKPIWDIIYAVVTTALIPVFQLLQAVVEIVFRVIADVIASFWNSVGKPIFDTMAWYVSNVLGPVFSWLGDKVIGPVFDEIAGKIEWVADHIVAPYFDAMKTAVHALGDVFSWLYDNVVSKVFDSIVDKIRDGVNQSIDLFNGLADGINWLADKLHVDVHIQHIPHVGSSGSAPGGVSGGKPGLTTLAQGGMIPAYVGAGWMTNGPRAIVGEGNPLHPEYVVPTDPVHNKRAMDLFARLGHDLGVPGYAVGGVLPDAHKFLSNVGGAVSGLTGGITGDAVSLLFKPYLAATNAILDRLPDGVIRGSATFARDMVVDWVKNQSLSGVVSDLAHGHSPFAAGGVLPVGMGVYDQGGLLRPGYTLAYNGTGRNEMVSTDASAKGREVHFHGDLSFPNVKSASDAEGFLTNLENLI